MWFEWPYTDIHTLNLDWILKLCKDIAVILNDPSKYFNKYIEENIDKFLPVAMYVEETMTIRMNAGEIPAQVANHVYNRTTETVEIKDGVINNSIKLLEGR